MKDMRIEDTALMEKWKGWRSEDEGEYQRRNYHVWIYQKSEEVKCGPSVELLSKNQKLDFGKSLNPGIAVKHGEVLPTASIIFSSNK